MGSCYSQRAVKAASSNNFIAMASNQSKIPSTKSRFGYRPPAGVKQAPSKENVNQNKNVLNGSRENLRKIECFTNKQNYERTKVLTGATLGSGKKLPTKEKDLINSEIKHGTEELPKKQANGSPKVRHGVPNKSNINSLLPKSNLRKPNGINGASSSENISAKLKYSDQNKSKAKSTSSLARVPQGKSDKSKTVTAVEKVQKPLLTSHVVRRPSPYSSTEKLNENNSLKRRSFGFGLKPPSSQSKAKSKPQPKPVATEKINGSQEKLSTDTASTQIRPASLDIAGRKIQPRPFGLNRKPRPLSAALSTSSSIATTHKSERSISCSSLGSTDLMLDTDCGLSDVSPMETPREENEGVFLAEHVSASETVNSTFTVDKHDNSTEIADEEIITQHLSKEITTGQRSPCAISDVDETEDAVWVKRENVDSHVKGGGCDKIAWAASPVEPECETVLSQALPSPINKPKQNGCEPDLSPPHSTPLKMKAESYPRQVSQPPGGVRLRHLSICDDSDMITVDIHSYRSMLQDLTVTKTMLFKLKRVLTEGADSSLNGLLTSLITSDSEKPDHNSLATENKQLQEEVARLKSELNARDEEIGRLRETKTTPSPECYNAATQTHKPNLNFDKGMLLRSQSEGEGQTIIRPSIKENLPDTTLTYYFVNKPAENDRKTVQGVGSNRPSLHQRPFSSQTSIKIPVNNRLSSDGYEPSMDVLTDDNVVILSPNSTFICNQSGHSSPNAPSKFMEFTKLPKPKHLSRLPLNRKK